MPANTAYVLSALEIDTDNSSNPIDFTLRIGWPQTERGASVTSPIRTTNAAATRQADVVTLTGAAQTALNAASATAAVVTQGGMTSGVSSRILDSNGTALLGFTSSNTLSDVITSPLTTANTANWISGKDSSAIAWDGTGRTLVLDAGATVTDAVAQTPSSTLHLGSTGSANFLNGYVSRLTLWNTKLVSPQSVFSLVSGPSLFGVNMPEAAYNFPLSYFGQAYFFPSSSDWAYLQSKGIKFVRLHIAWENLQPTLGAELNSTYLTALQNAISGANAHGVRVLVDLHNSARYAASGTWGTTVYSPGGGAGAYLLGDANLPVSDLTDLWTRLSTALVGTAGLAGYGLMNEPHDLASTSIWPTAAQAAINAIRVIDVATPIYVMGDNWGDAAHWNNPAFPLTGANLVYEAHQYFDDGSGNYSGTYSSYNTDTHAGVKDLLPWLTWLKKNNVQGYIGEFGVPNDATDNDPQWLVLEEWFMTILAQQGVPATMHYYGSSFNSSDTLNVAPKSGVDDPRLIRMLGQF
jgi:aryl-phospho-beta-D-glucosidase BglC (GH1 family)